MTHTAGKLAITGLLLTAVGVMPAAAQDEVVVNSGSARLATGDVSGVSAVRNPLGTPATDDAKAEPRSALLAPGTRGGSAVAPTPNARAFGSFGLPFTSTRVAVGASKSTSSDPNYLATTFPYRAVGKLVFSAGYCTASVILRSVIVTAA